MPAAELLLTEKASRTSSRDLASTSAGSSPSSSPTSNSVVVPAPILLGRERFLTRGREGKPAQEKHESTVCRTFCLPSALLVPAAFRVKNTFIDGFAEEDVEEDLPMGRIVTSPPRLLEGAAELTSGHESAPVDVEPLATRQPAVSLGSVGHGLGLCRPCGWYWRPQGCTNGMDCRHCHLCLAGDVRSRKKKALKARKAAARGSRR